MTRKVRRSSRPVNSGKFPPLRPSTIIAYRGHKREKSSQISVLLVQCQECSCSQCPQNENVQGDSCCDMRSVTTSTWSRRIIGMKLAIEWMEHPILRGFDLKILKPLESGEIDNKATSIDMWPRCDVDFAKSAL
jgi:hypothetical protein